jgi:uncharacterized membrane protein YgcG
MLALKGSQLAKYIQSGTQSPSPFLAPEKGKEDSKETPQHNPDYEAWVAKNQTVLNYLLSNMSKEILGQVNNEVTASGAWAAFEKLFSSQSWVWVISSRMALAMATKGTSSISEYYGKVKTLADEMASARRKLEDEELVSYILMGLDVDFDLVVLAVTACVEPITVAELYTQLITHEQRMEIRGGGSNQCSANMAAKGGRGQSNNGNRGGGRGGGGCGGFGRGNKGGHGGGGRNTF